MVKKMMKDKLKELNKNYNHKFQTAESQIKLMMHAFEFHKEGFKADDIKPDGYWKELEKLAKGKK